MFAWRMIRPVNLFGPFSGLPLVGLGSFAVQTSIEPNRITKAPSSPYRGRGGRTFQKRRLLINGDS